MPPRWPKLAAPPLTAAGTDAVLGFGLLALAPHLGRLPLWLGLGALAALGWRYLMSHHGRRPPPAWLRIGLTLLVGVAVFKHYGTWFGRDAGVGLLAGLLGLKLLELRQPRDGVVAVWVAAFLVLGAFLFEAQAWLALYALAAALAAAVALAALHRPDGVRLRLRAVAGMVGLALPLAAALFFFFPRLPGGLWGLPTASGALTGMSDSLEPGSITRLSENPAVAFRVRFEGTPPPPWLRYWRGLVLERTDGRRWTPARGGPAALRFTASGAPLRYTVMLEPHRQRWLFALDLPASVPPGARPGPGYTLRARQPVEGLFRYRITSYPTYRTPPLDPAERRRLLDLPRASPRVRELARRLTRAGDDRAVVRAALDHLRAGGYRYTLTPPAMADDPVDGLLFRYKAGYCEHYAAAFAALMRAAGIPARLVVGYQGGELNDTGGYLIVRQSDAHAWTEVWLAGEGWRRVDPTAVVAAERIQYGSRALRRLWEQGLPLGRLDDATLARAMELGAAGRLGEALALYWDAANTAWNEWFMGYGQERQFGLLAWLGLPNPRWLELFLALAAAAGLAVAVVAAGLLGRRPRQDPLPAAWQAFRAGLGRAGLPLADTDGPLAVARRLEALPEPRRSAAVGLAARYARLRYGPRPAPAEIVDFCKRVRRFNRPFGKQAVGKTGRGSPRVTG